MRFKSLFLGIVLSLMSVSLAFAGGVIKIGFFSPLTGFAAADGTSAKHGAMLAVEKINATGGILGKKVKLIVYDDAASSQQAVAIARKLIQENKVAAVVSGSYSTPTRASAPIYQRYHILWLLPMLRTLQSPKQETIFSESVFWQPWKGKQGVMLQQKSFMLNE